LVIASCHCGAIRIEVEAPTEVTECNCSICRRTGGRWAYYSPAQVHGLPLEGATDTYIWGDRCLVLHRCRQCGCVTHWSPVDPALDRMGVNARMMDPEVLAKARLRRIDGADTWEYLD
jgi:hypothetical protein